MKFIFISITCFFLLFPVYSQENTAVFRQEGIASWYGTEFAGKPTASGEIFNPQELTAAHPKLPFGTLVKVTNTHNGKQVMVRVNDRGPFAAARIIDLSQGAAEKLDMIITGTAPVIIETVNMVPVSGDLSVTNIGKSSAPTAGQEQPVQIVIQEEVKIPPKAETPVQIDQAPVEVQRNVNPPAIKVNPGIPAAGTGKFYRIQVGSYKIAKNAVEAFDTLKNAGLTPAYERYTDLYRVVLAQIKSDDVQLIVDILARAGFQEILIKEER